MILSIGPRLATVAEHDILREVGNKGMAKLRLAELALVLLDILDSYWILRRASAISLLSIAFLLLVIDELDLLRLLEVIHTGVTTLIEHLVC